MHLRFFELAGVLGQTSCLQLSVLTADDCVSKCSSYSCSVASNPLRASLESSDCRGVIFKISIFKALIALQRFDGCLRIILR